MFMFDDDDACEQNWLVERRSAPQGTDRPLFCKGFTHELRALQPAEQLGFYE